MYLLIVSIRLQIKSFDFFIVLQIFTINSSSFTIMISVFQAHHQMAMDFFHGNTSCTSILRTNPQLVTYLTIFVITVENIWPISLWFDNFGANIACLENTKIRKKSKMMPLVFFSWFMNSLSKLSLRWKHIFISSMENGCQIDMDWWEYHLFFLFNNFEGIPPSRANVFPIFETHH